MFEKAKKISLSQVLTEIKVDNYNTSICVEILRRDGKIELSGGRTIFSDKRKGVGYDYYLEIKDGSEMATPVSSEETTSDDSSGIVASTPSGTEIAVLFNRMEQIIEDTERDRDFFDEEDDDEDGDEDDDRPRGGYRPSYRASHRSRNTQPLVIGPGVYFQFVKSKLTQLEQENLTERLNKLKAMMQSAEAVGQTALYEALALNFVTLAREQEIAAIGCGKYISETIITKLIGLVKNKVIKYQPFEQFPRIIPADVAERIKRVQEAKVFDKLHIVYTDYTNTKLKTTHQKIKEKDPIVFGTIDELKGKLFYIADWIDEYCDLTLDKLIATVSTDDPTFKLNEVPEVTDEYIKQVIKDVEERQQRLDQTKASTYKRLMREEERAILERRERDALKETEAKLLNKAVPEKQSWVQLIVERIKNLVKTTETTVETTTES